MSDSRLIDVFKNINFDDIKGICFCGGEALIRLDLIREICNYIPNQVNKSLVSNGVLLTVENVKILKELNFHMVQVSVDGVEGTHNHIRNSVDAYHYAINAIENLHRFGIKIAVATLPTNKSIYELEQLYELLSAKGVTVFRMQPLMNMGRAEDIFTELQLSYDEETFLINLIEKLKIQYYPKIVEWGDPSDHLYIYKNNLVKSGTIDQLHISAAGEVGISPYIPYSMGSIKSNHLNSIACIENFDRFLKDSGVRECLDRMTDASKFNAAGDEIRLFTGQNKVV